MAEGLTDRAARAVSLLRDRGAATVDHPGGTLLAHLERVRRRLAEWGAREELQLAGLCHAFYGTDGFGASLLPLERRGELATAIGKEAEELVYFYASCDREASYKAPAADGALFRDRFTGRTFTPALARRHDFAELTAANELDLAVVNDEFRARWGGQLLMLFARFAPLLSETARKDLRTGLDPGREARTTFLRTLESGDVVRGVVAHIEPFGAFVELGGGLDSLLRIPEMSRRPIDHPSEVVRLGQEIKASVLHVDLDREQAYLSLKALEPHPAG